MVDGTLYVVTVFGRLIALEPEKGKERWAFDPKLDRTKSQMLYSSRGAALLDRRQRQAPVLRTLDWTVVGDKRRHRQNPSTVWHRRLRGLA